jgi:cyclopropane fatty-acyl-phospholipid synthase-like methyltransferase
MSDSVAQGKEQTKKWIVQNNIKTILDIGTGRGNYSDLLKGVNIEKIDGIEVWEPYIERYNLKNKYNNIFLYDVRQWENFNYDLIIFGDVLEHMTKEESIHVWQKASSMAKHAIISIPIIHFPQGESEGNPYQVHIKDDWSEKEVIETFSDIISYDIYPTVGVFYAKIKQFI